MEGRTIKIRPDTHIFLSRDPKTRLNTVLFRRLVPAGLIPMVTAEKQGTIIKVFKSVALWQNHFVISDDAMLAVFQLFESVFEEQEAKKEIKEPAEVT